MVKYSIDYARTKQEDLSFEELINSQNKRSQDVDSERLPKSCLPIKEIKFSSFYEPEVTQTIFTTYRNLHKELTAVMKDIRKIFVRIDEEADDCTGYYCPWGIVMTRHEKVITQYVKEKLAGNEKLLHSLWRATQKKKSLEHAINNWIETNIKPVLRKSV